MSSDSALAMENFEKALDLAALVWSAAACRGVVLSDHIARFLLRLACGLSAEITETNTSKTIPTSFGDWPRISAASSLVKVLSIKNGGPFWRQRIAHILLPDILKACAGAVGHDSALSQSTLSAHPLGPLSTDCHIVCCIPITALGEHNIKALKEVTVQGLLGFIALESIHPFLSYC